ncbi:hypothetical protein [Massilia sp. YMA4]|uniref:Bacteriocin n=1 Tax=[Empedobacter] haloabium TaxID=592317 RepID=A0ABZ1UJ35_9BURK|nr:hypothetical protein [Massilia sp. YMA4]
MAIRELAVEEFEIVSGAGSFCEDLYTGFGGGVGAVLGSGGGPAGTIIGGTLGGAAGGWLGRKFCTN